MNILRWFESLFLLALAIGVASLIMLRDPDHFWEDAWLPALAIASLGFWRWWIVRRG